MAHCAVLPVHRKPLRLTKHQCNVPNKRTSHSAAAVTTARSGIKQQIDFTVLGWEKAAKTPSVAIFSTREAPKACNITNKALQCSPIDQYGGQLVALAGQPVGEAGAATVDPHGWAARAPPSTGFAGVLQMLEATTSRKMAMERKPCAYWKSPRS